MKSYLPQYISYLSIEKNCSPLIINDYRLELEKFSEYIITKIGDLDEVNISLVRSYIQKIKEERNLSITSIYKKIAILKSYFNFLGDEEVIVKNPMKKIKFPRKE